MSNMARVPLRQAQQNRYSQRARLPFRGPRSQCSLTPLHRVILIAGRALLHGVEADCWDEQPGPVGRTPGLTWLLPNLSLLPLFLQPSRAFDNRGEPPGDLLDARLAAAVPSACLPSVCWAGFAVVPAS